MLCFNQAVAIALLKIKGLIKLVLAVFNDFIFQPKSRSGGIVQLENGLVKVIIVNDYMCRMFLFWLIRLPHWQTPSVSIIPYCSVTYWPLFA
ncbi:MAG: hypothetical protein UZ12_BCD005003184 [Bacteroidetes bacterium OLB12]|nr:MAG: hypothetical protein UZ12_BCD005003184 [Bacteroidetes bacterium OLB12]